MSTAAACTLDARSARTVHLATIQEPATETTTGSRLSVTSDEGMSRDGEAADMSLGCRCRFLPARSYRIVVRIGGLLSFHVIFQCKRYQGSVSSPTVRDFRGAMVGRADKGLLITTGSFTKDAKQEAQRDGAPPIDLIDGEALAQKIKELRIGVEVRTKMT